MVQAERWFRREQSDGYQLVWRYIPERYYWSGKTGGLEGYHLLRRWSGGLAIKASRLWDKGMVVIYIEKSVVRISS
jgi:hypothetical protein